MAVDLAAITGVEQSHISTRDQSLNQFDRFKEITLLLMAMESYPFFIELRLGYVDPKLRLIIRDVKDRFRLGKECHQVPHLTLFGPFTFKKGYNLKDVQRIIEKAAGNIYEIPFTINGWDEKKTPHDVMVNPSNWTIL